MNKIIRIFKAALAVFLSLVLMLAGTFLGDLFLFPFNHSGNDAIKFAGLYFSFIGIWVVIIAVCFLRKKNRKSFFLTIACLVIILTGRRFSSAD